VPTGLAWHGRSVLAQNTTRMAAGQRCVRVQEDSSQPPRRMRRVRSRICIILPSDSTDCSSTALVL